MRIIDPSIRVVDALSGWGIREAANPVKYPPSGIPAPTGEEERIVFGVEMVVRHVPQLIAGLLLAELLGPRDGSGAFRAAFQPAPADVDKLFTLLPQPVMLMERSEQVDRLVAAPTWDPGRIVCAVTVGNEEAGPFVIFDGQNRAKAWLLRGETGNLMADVIRTKQSPWKAGFHPGI